MMVSNHLLKLYYTNFKTLFHKSLFTTFKFLPPIILSTFLSDFFFIEVAGILL